jgi:hypothetical protein
MKHLLTTSISSAFFVLLLSPPMTEVAGFAQATSDQRPIVSADQDPAFLGEAGVGAINRYQAAVRQELLQEKYEQLEKLSAELRRSKARFPGGAWKLNKFYQGLNRPVDEGNVSEQAWINYLPKLQKWVAKYPTSVTAQVALGTAYLEYAWSARGLGFADTVTEEGWRLHRERLLKARKILEEARQLPEKCPHGYAAMETIAMAQGWERADFEKLFEEAIAYEPQYHYFFTYKANYLLPRWHGEPGDVEKFADETTRRQGGEYGSILYYLIVSEVADTYRSKTFSDTTFTWPRAKRGFQDLETKFGLNASHINGYCRMAGWAGDRQTALEMLNRIGDRWDPSEWGTRKNFEEFKAWADQSSRKSTLMRFWMVPIMAMTLVALVWYRIAKRRSQPA